MTPLRKILICKTPGGQVRHGKLLPWALSSHSLPCGLEIPKPGLLGWLRQKASSSLPNSARSQAEGHSGEPCSLHQGTQKWGVWAGQCGFRLLTAWASDLKFYIWSSASIILLSTRTVRCDTSRAGVLSLSPRDTGGWWIFVGGGQGV